MRRWVAAAAVLLAIAAALLALGEREPRPKAAEVEFPRAMRPEEWDRMKSRRVLPVATPAPAEPGVPEAPQRRDPFLVALPAAPGEAVIVFEANALRHSRLGELFVACMLERDPRGFERIERETGVDVLKDVDRVGFAGDAVVVSGFFDRARWSALEGRGLVPSRYGDAATIWTARGQGGGASGPVLGAWKDQLLVMGPDEGSVRLALDQVEGRAPAGAELPDEIAYGEVYGLVPGAALRRLAGDARDDLAERLAAAASRVEIHVDAMRDVAAVVRVRGDDRERLSDLARALGGAIAGARLEAGAVGDDRLSELLDAARVDLGDGSSFALELALPADRLEAWFARCGPAPGR
jgi:hypothetical protein